MYVCVSAALQRQESVLREKKFYTAIEFPESSRSGKNMVPMYISNDLLNHTRIQAEQAGNLLFSVCSYLT